MAEPSAPSNPPESHEAWANTTKSLVGSAQTVTSDLYAALEGTEIVHADSPKLGNSGRPRIVDKGPKHQKQIDARLDITKTALNLDEASSQRCQQILTLLQHERQAKWAALKVVEWRLALRERRPKQELFRDHLQDALEHEKKILEDSRKILADRAAKVKVSFEDCEANKVRLHRYVRYMVCEGQLNAPPPERSLSSGLGSPGSPRLEAEPATEEAPTGEDAALAFKKPMVPSTHEGLIQRAPVLHELSMELYFAGEKKIETQRVVCKNANEKVMAAFKKRYLENKELKEGLEGQMREMDEAMGIAEKSISRMKKDIEFFGKVQLQPKVDSTIALVEKIKVAKQGLADDLLRKVVSMRIDDTCRKITPERTCQPPESMPVAALLEGNGTRGSVPKGRKRAQPAGGMVRNQSSPAFVNGSIESAASTATTMNGLLDSMASTATTMPVRPASPAGISSPLKAAAAASMSMPL